MQRNNNGVTARLRENNLRRWEAYARRARQNIRQHTSNQNLQPRVVIQKPRIVNQHVAAKREKIIKRWEQYSRFNQYAYPTTEQASKSNANNQGKHKRVKHHWGPGVELGHNQNVYDHIDEKPKGDGAAKSDAKTEKKPEAKNVKDQNDEEDYPTCLSGLPTYAYDSDEECYYQESFKNDTTNFHNQQDWMSREQDYKSFKKQVEGFIKGAVEKERFDRMGPLSKIPPSINEEDDSHQPVSSNFNVYTAHSGVGSSTYSHFGRDTSNSDAQASFFKQQEDYRRKEKILKKLEEEAERQERYAKIGHGGYTGLSKDAKEKLRQLAEEDRKNPNQKIKCCVFL